MEKITKRKLSLKNDVIIGFMRGCRKSAVLPQRGLTWVCATDLPPLPVQSFIMLLQLCPQETQQRNYKEKSIIKKLIRVCLTPEQTVKLEEKQTFLQRFQGNQPKRRLTFNLHNRDSLFVHGSYNGIINKSRE